MYYVVYGILWLISLLPLRVLYLFSEVAFFFIYRVKGYRREVVMQNLAIAFPEKSEAERKKIAKDFYRNFTDSFIESIKIITMSERQVERRSTGEFDYINGLIDKGYNIHLMGGHQFNWEFANIVYARHLKIPFVGIYAPIGSKILDRLFQKTRAKHGTVLISARDFVSRMHGIFKGQHMVGLIADQNPPNASRGFWLNFFGKPAPFAAGPAKGAVKNNTAVVFIGFRKVKRGHYAFKATPIAEHGADYTPEQLTQMYRDVLEDTIRTDPANYLWTHRRWRHQWEEGFNPILP